MSNTEQIQAQTQTLETCAECGRSFAHTAFLNHLFASKECMKKYWKEEEKTHVYRLRHRVKPASIPN
ncbi:MAG: hypothetical protein ACYC7D_11970 [Nitrososphaerales archaeon]